MSDKKSEESMPVEEVKIPKTISFTEVVKSVLVLLISFVCILLGVSLYQIYRPLRDFHLVQPQTIQPDTPTVAQPTLPVAEKGQANTTLPVIPEPEVSPIPEVQIHPLAVSEPEIEPVEPKPTVEPIVEEEPVPAEPKMDKMTLTEALILRDKLSAGQSCLAEFQTLLKRQLPTELKDNLIADLMPVCSSHPVYPELKTSFLRNKRAAFLTYYKMNNPTWLAYTKSFLTRLVDFRRLNPVKKKPKDLIYLAQNALMANDLGHSLDYIQKLPPEIQSDFDEYTGFAKAYLIAQQAVEKLILSFDVKGE